MIYHLYSYLKLCQLIGSRFNQVFTMSMFHFHLCLFYVKWHWSLVKWLAEIVWLCLHYYRHYLTFALFFSAYSSVQLLSQELWILTYVFLWVSWDHNEMHFLLYSHPTIMCLPSVQCIGMLFACFVGYSYFRHLPSELWITSSADSTSLHWLYRNTDF